MYKWQIVQLSNLFFCLTVKCPAGTFHNLTKNYCQSCKIGDYQDSMGSIECKKCPNFTTTLKIRVKSLKDCKRKIEV